MYKVCAACSYASQEIAETTCPNCAQPLRFTTFPPPGFADPAGAAEAESELNLENCGEPMELPIAVRLSQIGGGAAAFLMIARWGFRLTPLLLDGQSVTTVPQAIFVGGCALLLFLLASLVGGAVAGACSMNWVPQGIGVGITVFLLPMLLILLTDPSSLFVCFLGVLITTPVTVIGAYLGHKALRPYRYYG